MPSDRLRKVYESAEWRGPIRKRVLERAGYRCQWVTTNVFGEQHRCTVIDKKRGGTESLTVDHTDEFADPLDVDKLAALCRRHHGEKDGRRARHRKDTW
jgi:hypothetical protein